MAELLLFWFADVGSIHSRGFAFFGFTGYEISQRSASFPFFGGK